MKRLKLIFAFVLSLAILASVAVVPTFATERSVAAENNIATWKYDWHTDGVGSYKITYSDTGMKFENFGSGNSLFATYKTNAMTSYDISMYTKLNLTIPEADPADPKYTALHMGLIITAGADNEHLSGYACPWYAGGTNSNAWLGIVFENNNNVPKIDLMLYYSVAGQGSAYGTYLANATATPQYLDGNYHWYDIKVSAVSGTANDGLQIKVYEDDVEMINYFVPNTMNLGAYPGTYPFSTTAGRFGFWTMGNAWAGTVDTATSNMFVDIQQMQVTNTADGNDIPYTLCEKPDTLEANTGLSLSPVSTGSEASANVANMFTYEGDGTIDYTAEYVSYSGDYASQVTFTEGDAIGTVTDGTWKFTPNIPGRYKVKFTANTSTGKTASVELNIRVNGELIGGGDNAGGGDVAGGGCGGSMEVPVIVGTLALVAGAALLIKRKVRN